MIKTLKQASHGKQIAIGIGLSLLLYGLALTIVWATMSFVGSPTDRNDTLLAFALGLTAATALATILGIVILIVKLPWISIGIFLTIAIPLLTMNGCLVQVPFWS